MSEEHAEGTAGAVAEEDYEDDDTRKFRYRHEDRRFFTDSLEYDVAKAEDLFARARNALCAGFAVRDRLMHPKDADDVCVSDDDLARVRRGRDLSLLSLPGTGHPRRRSPSA